MATGNEAATARIAQTNRGTGLRGRCGGSWRVWRAKVGMAAVTGFEPSGMHNRTLVGPAAPGFNGRPGGQLHVASAPRGPGFCGLFWKTLF